MAEPVRFYMDQHYPESVSEGLHQRGIDVLTAQEAGRCGFSDSEQLKFAASEERILVTFDSDYLDLHRMGTPHAGIVWCPQQKYRVGMLVQLLELLYGLTDGESMRNYVEYL